MEKRLIILGVGFQMKRPDRGYKKHSSVHYTLTGKLGLQASQKCRKEKPLSARRQVAKSI